MTARCNTFLIVTCAYFVLEWIYYYSESDNSCKNVEQTAGVAKCRRAGGPLSIAQPAQSIAMPLEGEETAGRRDWLGKTFDPQVVLFSQKRT